MPAHLWGDGSRGRYERLTRGMDEEQTFSKQFADKVKASLLEQFESKRDSHEDSLKHWRAWGSWFSWGSPVGLGLFIISIGVFLVLLHYAGLLGR